MKTKSRLELAIVIVLVLLLLFCIPELLQLRIVIDTWLLNLFSGK